MYFTDYNLIMPSSHINNALLSILTEPGSIASLLVGAIIYLHTQLLYWRKKYDDLFEKFNQVVDAEINYYRKKETKKKK